MTRPSRPTRLLSRTLGLLGAAAVLAGCATSEKSVYERHLHTTVKADASSAPSVTLIGASRVQAPRTLASRR